MKRDDPAYAAQKHYTPWFLKIYDPVVLGFFATTVWRCPSPRLLANYDRHLGRNHLDVGPGTGYFLQHARVPANASLAIADPNRNVLTHVTQRLAPRDVSAIEADVCKPLIDRVDNRRFDSVALNLVLHCLPGPCKAAAIAHVATVLKPDGVLFGATVLGSPELNTAISRPLLRLYNRIGAFNNLADTEHGLREILSDSFVTTDIEIVGSIAIFAAKGPRQLPT